MRKLEHIKIFLQTVFYVVSYTLLTGILNILRIDLKKVCQKLYGGHYPHSNNVNDEAVIQCQVCKKIMGDDEMPKNYIPECWEKMIKSKQSIHRHIQKRNGSLV